jgi:serine/threonine protein kinase
MADRTFLYLHWSIVPVSTSLFCPHCGASNSPQNIACFACEQPLLFNSPKSFSVTDPHLLKQRYSILRPLGQGGMGAVYEAEDTELGNRRIAVKELSQRSLSPSEIIAAADSFKHEAHLLAALTHPHLPRIYDHFSEDGRWYLVMDFIEGETFEAYLDRHRPATLPLDEILDYALQLCSVLDYLHTRQPPIIFRDLKPSNIMRSSDGQLYLIDFGIARYDCFRFPWLCRPRAIWQDADHSSCRPL